MLALLHCSCVCQVCARACVCVRVCACVRACVHVLGGMYTCVPNSACAVRRDNHSSSTQGHAETLQSAAEVEEGESSVCEGERQSVHVLIPRVISILVFHTCIDYIALQGLARHYYNCYYIIYKYYKIILRLIRL